MRKNKFLIASGIFLLAAVIIACLWSQDLTKDGTTQTISFHTQVCVYKNGVPIGCNHNILTNAGKDHIKYLLGVGLNSPAIYLALGNTTAPTETDTSLPGEITGCGLDRAQGTYYSNGVGNWTISHTWTSSCTITVNTTGLYNATSGGTFFSGTSFSSVDLQADDQLTINYTIWVS